MKKQQIRLICFSGLLAALVLVLTAFVHIPVHTGYVHVGDAFIYLGACLLPVPYAPLVGAVGAALADCISGYALWAPGSLIVKTLTVFLFSSKSTKMLTLRNGLATIPAAAICIGGYYLYEALITGNFAAPLAGMLGNLFQSAASGIIFIVLAAAADKLKLKSKLLETK